MAVDAFLKLDGIYGEVQGEFEKWISIESFSWGMSQTGSTASGGGGGAGKVTVHDISISKQTDKASAALFQKCATGAHISTGSLYVRKAGGDASGAQGGGIFLKIDLEDVLVSSVQFEGASQGDDRPSEDVTLNFAKIEFEYDAPDGEVDQFSWDLAQNRS